MPPRRQAQKELQKELRKHLKWYKSRVDFLANFLFTRLAVRTVNLAEIATAFYGAAQVESHSKRLPRFFKGFSLGTGH